MSRKKSQVLSGASGCSEAWATDPQPTSKRPFSPLFPIVTTTPSTTGSGELPSATPSLCESASSNDEGASSRTQVLYQKTLKAFTPSWMKRSRKKPSDGSTEEIAPRTLGREALLDNIGITAAAARQDVHVLWMDSAAPCPDIPSWCRALLVPVERSRVTEAEADLQKVVSQQRDCEGRRSPSAPSIFVVLTDIADDMLQAVSGLSEAIHALQDCGVDEVLTNSRSEATFETSVSLSLVRSQSRKGVLREAWQQGFDAATQLFEAGRQEAPRPRSEASAHEDSDTVSFCYSLSTIGPAAPKRPESNSFHFSETSAGKVDCGVNTDVAMLGSGFQCMRCSKPPKESEESREIIALAHFKQQRLREKVRKALRKNSASEAPAEPRQAPTPEFVQYPGSAFDGVWLAAATDGEPKAPEYFNPWLRQLHISGSRVTLGDGDEENLLLNQDGHCFLCSGEVALDQNGRLCRTGGSGVTVTFVRHTEGHDVATRLGGQAYCADRESTRSRRNMRASSRQA